MSKLRELQKRWIACPEILDSFLNGNLLQSPFGLTDKGNKDYRGWILERNVRPDGLNISCCDFGMLSAPKIIFANSTIEDSDFTQASFSIGNYGSLIKNVNFSRAKLPGSGLGMNGALYVNCDFTNVDLSGSNGLTAKFENCRFESTKWNDSLLSGCVFIGCRFSGQIRGVIFGGENDAYMEDCDVSEVSFVDCAFYKFRFNSCNFSRDTLIFHNWPKALGIFSDKVAAIPDRKISDIANIWIQVWKDSLIITTDAVVDRHDLIKQEGSVVGEMFFKVFQEIYEKEHTGKDEKA